MDIQPWQLAYRKLNIFDNEIVAISHLSCDCRNLSDVKYLMQEILLVRYSLFKEVREKFEVADCEPYFREVYINLNAVTQKLVQLEQKFAIVEE